MKKVLCILAAVALLAAFSTSCKKECTCTTSTAGVAAASVSAGSISKKDCDALNKTISTAGVEIKTVCKQ